MVCRQVILPLHLHAEADEQIDAYLKDLLGTVQEAVDGDLAMMHPGVEVMELEEDGDGESE